MKPVSSSMVLLVALLLSSCDDSASVPPANPAAVSKLQAELDGPDMPRVGFSWVSFQYQGGIMGNGNGESLRLTSDGLLTRVAAKPLQTDSGPQWSGLYDTTTLWIRAADLQHVDSVLQDLRENPRKDVPDSAFASCRPIFDSYYWTAWTSWQGSDIVSAWQTSPMGCFDGKGVTMPTPVSEDVVVLQTLERYLMTTYFPSDSSAQ